MAAVSPSPWLRHPNLGFVETPAAAAAVTVYLQDRLHNAGFYVDVETSNKTLNKKVREGVTAKYNYILVVGEAEEVHT